MSTSSRNRKTSGRRRTAQPRRRSDARRVRKAATKSGTIASSLRGRVRASRSRAAPAPMRKSRRALLERLTSLRVGSRGPAVRRLQRSLTDRGFRCGAIDGEFGHGTEAAVIAFQLSEGLLPDGVAGPRTLTALGLMTDDSLPSSAGELTVQVAAAMCPGATRQHQGQSSGGLAGDERTRTRRPADAADGGRDDLRGNGPLRAARRIPLAVQHVAECGTALLRPV